MSITEAVVVSSNLLTCYGEGSEVLCSGLMNNKNGIKECERFPTDNMRSSVAGLISGCDVKTGESRLISLFKKLLVSDSESLTQDGLLIFATTTGEIDLVEKCAHTNSVSCEGLGVVSTLGKLQKITGHERGVVVSAACASFTSAMGTALSLIRSGREDCVLVASGDIVSEFVFSGFSSLQALDKKIARPFDQNRRGLTLGESVGYILLMSEERAKKENRPVRARVGGYASISDAKHMTAPARDGSGLARTIKLSLKDAEVNETDISFISAHGTGTAYNDMMEVKAFSSVFQQSKPCFSVKGGTGHTMSSAGLIQCVVSIDALFKGVIPPTVGVENVELEAKGWVSDKSQSFTGESCLIVNAGFGGINSALVITK